MTEEELLNILEESDSEFDGNSSDTSVDENYEPESEENIQEQHDEHNVEREIEDQEDVEVVNWGDNPNSM